MNNANNQDAAFGRMSGLRSPGQVKPITFIVDARGKIRRKAFAPHTGNGIDDLDREGALTSHAMRAGKVLLQDLYARDSRPEVRERGFQLYCDYDRAGAADNLPKVSKVVRTMQDGTKHVRNFPQPFDEEWLPEEVIARRTGASDLSTSTFEMPASPGKAEAPHAELAVPYKAPKKAKPSAKND